MIGFLSSIGVAQGGAAVLAFLALLAACVLVGLLLRRTARTARVAWLLSGLAALAALAFTLWPNTGSSTGSCTIELSWTSPFEVQNLANIALFVPITFFATLACRRPGRVTAAGTGLSAAIELVQALLPALNRACDAQDWQMNTIGAVLGAALGWWIGQSGARTATRPPGGSPGPTSRRVNWIWTVAAATAITGWLIACALDPTPSDPCAESAAGPATELPGGVSVQAGSETGRLCIRSAGGSSGLDQNPTPGTIETIGSGRNQWSIGLAPASALTARDERGTITRTKAVHGSTLRIWSTYRDTAPAGTAP